MRIQVLVSTMHQTDYNLLEKMNIKTDAIVVNQCDNNSIAEFEHNSNKVRWMSFAERGVGLSRNTALMRSDADIILFADDDVVYDDDYATKVVRAFEKYPNADLIVFNLESLNPDRPEIMVNADCRLHWYNCLKFGAVRIAVRRQAILNRNVFYSLLFGGGAKYQAGEDNLFITQCLQRGIICMASSTCIGTVKQEASTWFKGYDEKYYFDRGALFTALYGKWAKVVITMFELKNIKNIKGIHNRLKAEFKGIKAYGSNETVNMTKENKCCEKV